MVRSARMDQHQGREAATWLLGVQTICELSLGGRWVTGKQEGQTGRRFPLLGKRVPDFVELVVQ